MARYDAEWPAWLEGMTRWLDSASRRVPDLGFPMILPARRPVAFVRSVLAGMFAFTPTLRHRWPKIAEAVRTGDAMKSPTDLLLLGHLYSGPYTFAASGIGKVDHSPSRVAGASFEAILGEIAWPPLHFVLVHPDDGDRWPMAMDVTGWLEHEWRVVRDVTLLLHLLPVDQLFSSGFGTQPRAATNRPRQATYRKGVRLRRKKSSAPTSPPGGHSPMMRTAGTLLHSEPLPAAAHAEDAVALGIAAFTGLLALDPPSPLVNFKATTKNVWTLNPTARSTAWCPGET